jgi:hypothetical protein
MLAATVGALAASIIHAKYIYFEGDSSYICGLLGGIYNPSDMFFYNCLEVAKDLLHPAFIHASWISRNLNGVCDSLARTAASEKELFFWHDPSIDIPFSRL